MFAREDKLLQFKSASDKQLLEITNLKFKLGHMGFNSFPYSIQKLYSSFHCNQNNYYFSLLLLYPKYLQ